MITKIIKRRNPDKLENSQKGEESRFSSNSKTFFIQILIPADGEFFFGTLLSGLAGIARGITKVAEGEGIEGFFEGFAEGVWNGIKIDAGNFAWDSNLNFGENLLNIASRFTWEAPQQFLGNFYGFVMQMYQLLT